NAARHYTPTPLPLVRPADALKARVWIRLGNLDAAYQWLEQSAPSSDGDITYVNEFEYLTLARLLIASDDLAGAGSLLDRLLQSAQDANRMGSAIDILSLQALVHFSSGNIPDALTKLEGALRLAEPEGYVRLFVDEGTPMANLLRVALKHEMYPAYVRRLLASFDGTLSPTGQQIVDPLSDRELDVLRLLNTELSGPEIARELVISLNTFRTHTKNIYSKLGVISRRATVRRAAELDLV
ncbi:MAG: LuxR C-terminal-related transcriptional regulator, partial [Chloroflexota bacterium]